VHAIQLPVGSGHLEKEMALGKIEALCPFVTLGMMVFLPSSLCVEIPCPLVTQSFAGYYWWWWLMPVNSPWAPQYLLLILISLKIAHTLYTSENNPNINFLHNLSWSFCLFLRLWVVHGKDDINIQLLQSLSIPDSYMLTY
jgi:hypothetical protein